MERIEKLLESGKLVPLRKGLASKETYRMGNIVLGVVDTRKLDPQDREPFLICGFVKDYISELKRVGVPVVNVLDVDVQGSCVVIITEYVPRFLDERMCSGEIGFRQGATNVLQIIELSSESSAGIDPTPKNFAVSENGIEYTDFFHPFTKEYVAWTRSHMDPNNPHHRYIQFVQDYMFYPKVYAHVASDLTDLAIVEPGFVIDFVSDFCKSRLPDFGLETELSYYKNQKLFLKSLE